MTRASAVVDAGGGALARGAVFRVAGGIAGKDDLSLLRAAGVRRYVDLRGEHEHRERVLEWAQAGGVEYVHAPIENAGTRMLLWQAQDASTGPGAPGRLGAVYRAILDDNAVALVTALRALSGAGASAFGCSAGKDRTGLVSALLHVLLGEAEAEAAERFAAEAPTPDALRPLVELYPDLVAGVPPAVIEEILSAPAAVMRATLAGVRERHGSVAGYLREAGLGDAEQATLRDRLSA